MTRCLALLLLVCTTQPLLAQGKAKKKAAAANPAAAVPDDAPVDENIPRVVPVFDPGSHTRMIRALGFNRDQSRLITVGEDSSIQIWSTSTGERLDILRLPAYGHEQSYVTREWSVAAISADGNWVALGGGADPVDDSMRTGRLARLLIVDVARRKLRVIDDLRGQVTALTFGNDNRLAVALNARRKVYEILMYPAPIPGLAEYGQRSQALITTLQDVNRQIELMQFSPDGRRFYASAPLEFYLFDVGADGLKLTRKVEPEGSHTALAWTPNSQHVVRCRTAFLNQPKGLELWSAAGKLEWDLVYTDETSPFQRDTHVRSIAFLDQETMLLSANDGTDPKSFGATTIRFNLTTKTGMRLRSTPEAARYHVFGTLSPKKDLAAIAVSTGLDVVVYRVADGSEVARCGAASPVPTLVGWSAAGEPASIAWSETGKLGKVNTEVSDLQFAFDLAELQPVGNFDPANFEVSRRKLRDWTLRLATANSVELVRGDERHGTGQGGTNMSAGALIPRGAESPWFVWSANLSQKSTCHVTIAKTDGTVAARLKPASIFVRDLVPSPDGRYLLVSTGMHRLAIYAVDGGGFPLLSFARVNGEWVAWASEGYFTASPGGEKLFGWSESHGPEAFATFHPAEKFAKYFRRPDLLKRAIELGSMSAALQQAETRSPVIEDILPPKSELELVAVKGNRAEVRGKATPSAKDKPIISLRLLLDGRPLAGGVGQKSLQTGEKSEATWEIDIPAGSHELKLLARNADSSAVSAPLMVTGPKSESSQPVLHRLCVGINEYQISAFNLSSAAKDATDVFAALEQHCVGPQNRFGSVKGTVLTNQQATRAGVLKAIGDIRKAAKPGDLVVFLFAGHGIKQQEEFYLMTHEADPSDSLAGKSLSGADLRQALADMECPVLLIMDACHSASGVKAFRPATDDLTRSLTDDTAGVTVMAAAMAHEVATATQENGHFTAAFLKALQLGQGVPFDPYEHVLYTHHIYSVVFSEVRKATNGKQNPFLNMPWTVPPLAIRDVP